MMRKSVISNIFAALLTLLLIGIFCDLNAQPRPLQLLHGDVTCDAQGNSQQNGWLRFDYSGDRDNYSWYWLKNGRIFQGRQDAITNLDWGDVYHLIVSATDCGKIIYEEEYVMGLDCGNSDPLEIRVEVKQPYTCIDNYDIYVTPIVTGGKPPYTLSRQEFVIPGTTLIPGRYTGVFDVFDADFNTASATYDFWVLESANSADPNEITGPIGYDSLKMVNTFDKMRYQINFENDPDFATASANRVSINYDIPANQKVNSFRLSDFGFGNFTFTVPSNATSYYKRLNLQEDLGIWLDVTAGLDITNRKAFWIFQTIDPETGYAPADSRNGFLAINDSLGSGEGFVNFTISPADNLHTGDTVSAIASIIFDDNAAIETNVWTNTFDAVAPQSSVSVQRNSDDSLSCTLLFTAQDDPNGSGVQFIELFISENEEGYNSVGYFLPDSSYQYSISEGVNYSFISQATDNVNNVEIFHTSTDAVLDLSSAPTDIALQGGYFRENDPVGTIVGTLTSEDANTRQNFEYNLVDGEGNEDNDDFYIQDNLLLTNNIFSCNGQYTYNIRVMTTNQNGYSFEKAFEIQMLRENYPQVKTIRKNICTNDSYYFKGQYLTESGTYTDTLVSHYGCDSIVILKLNVFDSPNIILEESICQDEEFHNYGFDVPSDSTTSPRTLVLTHTDYCLSTGCDSTTTLYLTINGKAIESFEAESCDSYTWNDSTYTQSGDYIQHFQTIHGCDSTVTLHLTIFNSEITEFEAESCDSYAWNDSTYTQSGDFVQLFQSVHGCDSTVTLHLTIFNSEITEFEAENCEIYTWNDSTYTQSGDYIQHFQTVHGCDSTVTLHLTIFNSEITEFEAESCDSYTWNDSTYTQSGDYIQHFQTVHGCDSTVTLHLTIYNSVATAFEAENCDSYTWNDSTYTQSGDYIQHFQTIHGCDSTVTLHLTIFNSEITAFEAENCDNYTWNDSTYTQSGEYIQLFQTIHGCDSIVTLHLTIFNSENTEFETESCEIYTWNDSNYTQSGDYVQHFQTVHGCDSTVTLHLTIFNGENTEFEAESCDSFTWNDSTYTQSGDYVQLFQNVHGCDSTVTLHLTIFNGENTAFEAESCDSYTWNDSTYTQSGDYVQLFQNVHGCDSMVTLHLTIFNSISINLTDEICQGSEYHNNGFFVSADSTITPGILTLTNHNSASATGCDSTTTLQLTINPILSVNLTDEICQGSEYHNNGFFVSADSTMTPGILTLTNHNSASATGCDSTTTLQLTINPILSVNLTDEICQGSEYYANGFYVPADSTMTPRTITLTRYATSELTACDSTTTLQLTVHPLPIVVITGDTIITLGESVTLTANGAQSYVWNTGDNTASIVVAPTINTLYSVIGSTEYNCQGSDSIKVYVSTGITSYQSDAVQLYPNPAHHHIEIDLADEIELKHAVIYDAIGRQVYDCSTQPAQNHLSVAVNSWSNGMYFVHLHTSKGLIIKKFVKE